MLCPGPGLGDADFAFALAADDAGCGVQQAVAQGFGFGFRVSGLRRSVWPAVPGNKSSTNRITQHHPTSTNIDQHRPASPQMKPRSDRQSPGRSCLSCATSANAARSTKTCPRRAGRPPGWSGTRIPATGPGRAGCGIPPASPKGYHTTAQGQSHTRHAPVPSRAAPGPPRGWATPGRRDATQAVACKIGDRSPVEKPRRETPDGESDVWQPAHRRSEAATEEPPDLHQSVHQRLRTTMDILGR